MVVSVGLPLASAISSSNDADSSLILVSLAQEERAIAKSSSKGLSRSGKLALFIRQMLLLFH